MLVTFSVFTVSKFNELLPKFLELSVFGIKSESNLAVIVTSSVVAFPTVVFPFNAVVTLTVKLPVTVAPPTSILLVVVDPTSVTWSSVGVTTAAGETNTNSLVVVDTVKYCPAVPVAVGRVNAAFTVKLPTSIPLVVLEPTAVTWSKVGVTTPLNTAVQFVPSKACNSSSVVS